MHICKHAHAITGHSLSRRSFGGIVAAGLAYSIVPAKAAAHAADALVVTCMDYRLVDDATKFFDGLKLTNRYDQISMAGATLAATSPKLASMNAVFWEHIGLAKQLHGITKVIMVDPRDCGAYRLVLGAAANIARDAETELYRKEMVTLKADIAKRHPDLGSEFYLMDLNGQAAKIL